MVCGRHNYMIPNNKTYFDKKIKVTFCKEMAKLLFLRNLGMLGHTHKMIVLIQRNLRLSAGKK